MKKSFILLVIISILTLPLLSSCLTLESARSAKAVIINQLYSVKPESTFISQVVPELNDFGFEVDIYESDDVTVELLKKLPGYGYKLVILRVHAGLLVKEGEMAPGTWLFTSEPHNPLKYIDERRTEKIVKARTTENQSWIFAVGSKFVNDCMEGQFDNSVILAMGCFSLYHQDLAQAFVDKGAGAYVGWTGNVGLDYDDEAMLKLIDMLCVQETNIAQAVKLVRKDLGPEPFYDTRLEYYPVASGNKTLKQLLNDK